MKALRIFSALLLIVSVLLVPISAADFVPSIEEKLLDLVDMDEAEDGSPIVGYIRTEDGTLVATLTRKNTTITNLCESDTAAEAIRNDLLAAQKQLSDTSLTELLPTFADEWAELTEGGPVSNAVITHLFDISTIYEIPANTTIYFELVNHNISVGTPVTILHNYDGDKWEIVPCDYDEDGHICFTIDSLSPFALVADNAAAPAVDANAPQSPSTEQLPVNFAPVMVSVVLFAFACLCFAKSFKRASK